MKISRQQFALLFFLLSFGFAGTAQVAEDTLSKKEIRKNRPAYLVVQVGGGISYFNDFATSPVTYIGSHFSAGLGLTRMDAKREYTTMIQNSVGMYVNLSPKMIASSVGMTYQMYHSQLFRINKWSKDNKNFKVGGMVNLFGDVRNNGSLLNNGLGMEGFVNLMGSAQHTWDISRLKDTTIHIAFLKFNLKANKRHFGLRFNLGLWNNDLRNGYAYMGNSALINEIPIFDGYSIHSFKGARMSGSMYYDVYTKTKNMYRFSYDWDAVKSNHEFELFQMALHTFRVSIFINRNK